MSVVQVKKIQPSIIHPSCLLPPFPLCADMGGWFAGLHPQLIAASTNESDEHPHACRHGENTTAATVQGPWCGVEANGQSCWCAGSPGPMKEKDLRPGTVFPVLGTLLFFLPERYKEKLCCVTPLASEVGYPFLSARLFSQFACSLLLDLISPQTSTPSLSTLARRTWGLPVRRRAMAKKRTPR